MSLPTDKLSSILDPEILTYLGGLEAEDPFLDQLEAHAAAHHFPLIGRQSGRLIELLCRIGGIRRAFEFGAGWGYSAFFFARGGAQVIGAERDPWELEHHARLFAGHPLKASIHIVHGSALDVFEKTSGDFDAILLDLHKEDYAMALDVALPRLRPGGLVLADNVLWGGRTARGAGDASTQALIAYNQRIFRDPRLSSVIVPVGDGLAISRKQG
jgi:predicted O-methyltransferase YrrM